MNPERYARMKELFLTASALPPESRPSYLDEACGDDRDLRAEVDSMLGHLDRPAGILMTGALASVAAGAFGEGASPRGSHARIPDRIGPCRILGILGEGGMGIVYHAEQTEPVQREVALKLIRGGADSATVLARFEAERQTLAMMDHPCIARLYDAGSTEEGRPYFLMELIRGAPLTEYATSNHLSTRARLELFLKVCGGVRHAHQRGIIHRDLKPSNIMVTEVGGEAQPRIIDFSVAKALSEPMVGTEFRTREGQVVGTLQYMAPEQAAGRIDALDTRTDIYALGVILYELVAGILPIDVHDLPLHEAIRRIVEVTPRFPSAGRGGNTASAVSRFDGDLATIAGKCLEKDPDRRYGSAAELAEDVERYLTSRPIAARPPSTAYQMRMLVARNRLAAVFLVTVFVLLSVFAAVTSVQLAEQRRARAAAEVEKLRAESEVRKVQGINAFLQEILSQASPWKMGENATIRQVLDAAAAQVDSGPMEDPAVRAELHTTLKQTYTRIGELNVALKHAERALALRLEVDGLNHPAVAMARLQHGGHLKALGRFDEAEVEVAEAVRILRAHYQGDHADLAASLRGLSDIAHERGRIQAALAPAEEALAMNARLGGVGGREAVSSRGQVGDVLSSLGRRQEGEILLRESSYHMKSLVGDDGDAYPLGLHNLAKNLRAQGRLEEAIALNAEALERRVTLYGADHWWVGRSRNNLAECLVEMGRCEEAEANAREALRLWSRSSANVWSDTVKSWLHVGRSRQCLGDYATAGDAYASGWRIAQEHAPEKPPQVSALSGSLGILKARLGHSKEGEPLVRGWLASMERWEGLSPADRWQPLIELGSLVLEDGGPKEAETLLREGLRVMEEAGPENPGSMMIAAYSAIARAALGRSLAAQGRPMEARDLIASARQALADGPAAVDSRRHELRRAAELYAKLGDVEGASFCRAALARLDGRESEVAAVSAKPPEPR